jgi:hypothetical protein
MSPRRGICKLELLHSMVVHEFLVGDHRLLRDIWIDALSKALLGSDGCNDRALDRNRHLREVAGG